MNRITCPGCGHRLKYRADQAGKRARCTRCDNTIVLPLSAETTATPATEPQPARSPPIAPAGRRPFCWEARGGGSAASDLVSVTAGALGYYPNVPPEDRKRAWAELTRGEGSTTAGGLESVPVPGTVVVPISSITRVRKRTSKWNSSVEVEFDRGGEPAPPLAMCMDPGACDRGFEALQARLGVHWRSRTARAFRRSSTFGGDLAVGVFATFFIGILTALGYTSVGQFPGIPWPIALIGAVILAPLVPLFFRLDMPRTAGLPLFLIVCLIAGVIGQMGMILVGVGLAVWFWVWYTRSMLLEAETVVFLSRDGPHT